MKKFIEQTCKFTLVGLIPFFILSILYLYLDPFKVLYFYKDFSYPSVITNRDYISTEILLKNLYRHKYNSFIFGSSRTLAFKPETWKKYLNIQDNPFVFEASNESIYGIYTKLKFLDSINVKMDNALIVICRDKIFENTENHEGHLFIKHPATSGENKLDFQLVFFRAYLDPNFLFNYYAFNTINKYKSFMLGYIENRKVTYDTTNNEFNAIDQQMEIARNPTGYYATRSKMFYERDEEQLDTVRNKIESKHLFMLKEVKRLLEKNNTNYKLVISPLYEQKRFSNNDLVVLRTLYGRRLYDFSGKNEFTESKTNYYESSHYRPEVGDNILRTIYEKSRNNSRQLASERSTHRFK